jgi:hypothetical protein
MSYGHTVMQIRGSSILLYDEQVRMYSGGGKSIRRMENMRQQAKKAYSGAMTQGSRKRLAKAITIMCQATKPRWITNSVSNKMNYHRFAFITLTVSSPHNITARKAYDDLLSHFLDWMTRTVGAKNPAAKTYVWKAELQKRGQIHYHITTPAFIHMHAIRDKWNDLQRRAGLLDEYAAKHLHYNAPSTDIKETRSVRRADKYLIKELAKSVDAIEVEVREKVLQMVERGELDASRIDEKIEKLRTEKLSTVGKIWGCSGDLAGVGYFTLSETLRHGRMIDQWIREGKARKVSDDFFAVVILEDDVEPPDLLDPGEKAAFNDYLKYVMKREDPKQEAETIPAECLQMELLEVEQEYTWNQLILNLN